MPVIEININITKNHGLCLQGASQTTVELLVWLELLAVLVGLELLAVLVGLELLAVLVGLELLAVLVGLELLVVPGVGSCRCTMLAVKRN
jgi:hypothetical protein